MSALNVIEKAAPFFGSIVVPATRSVEKFSVENFADFIVSAVLPSLITENFGVELTVL